MLTFPEMLTMTPEQLDAQRVTCATCPVSLHCVAGGYGTGWTYDCCRITTIRVETEEGQKLLVVDCGKHNFIQKSIAHDYPLCPMCKGDWIVDGRGAESLTNLEVMRYLPTAYARVNSYTRLRSLRAP